jgi:hypothetical protein
LVLDWEKVHFLAEISVFLLKKRKEIGLKILIQAKEASAAP